MPDNTDNTDAPNPMQPSKTTKKVKRRKDGSLRFEIAIRLSSTDKAERELLVDPDLADLERMTDEQVDRLGLTVDEWVNHVVARKKAQHRPRPGQKVARPASIPKWLRPHCGAKTRAGGRCRATPVWDKANNRPRNGRCRMHGGLSTGPRTPEGRGKALSKLKQNRGTG